MLPCPVASPHVYYLADGSKSSWTMASVYSPSGPSALKLFSGPVPVLGQQTLAQYSRLIVQSASGLYGSQAIQHQELSNAFWSSRNLPGRQGR